MRQKVRPRVSPRLIDHKAHDHERDAGNQQDPAEHCQAPAPAPSHSGQARGPPRASLPPCTRTACAQVGAPPGPNAHFPSARPLAYSEGLEKLTTSRHVGFRQQGFCKRDGSKLSIFLGPRFTRGAMAPAAHSKHRRSNQNPPPWDDFPPESRPPARARFSQSSHSAQK